jgi:hypothetical protein
MIVGFVSSVKKFYSLSDALGIHEEARTSSFSSNKSAKVSSFGCSFVRGRNTLVPGLRARTYTGGSATW